MSRLTTGVLLLNGGASIAMLVLLWQLGSFPMLPFFRVSLALRFSLAFFIAGLLLAALSLITTYVQHAGELSPAHRKWRAITVTLTALSACCFCVGAFLGLGVFGYVTPDEFKTPNSRLISVSLILA